MCQTGRPRVACLRTIWLRWCENYNLLPCVQSNCMSSWLRGRLRKCVQALILYCWIIYLHVENTTLLRCQECREFPKTIKNSKSKKKLSGTILKMNSPYYLHLMRREMNSRCVNSNVDVNLHLTLPTLIQTKS